MPTAIEDIRDWMSSGLPIFAVWHVDGHTPAWQVQQIEAGHRIMPTFRLPDYSRFEQNCINERFIGKYFPIIEPSLHYCRDNGLGICLRTNNVGDAFNGPDYKFPKPPPPTPEQIAANALVWFMKDGALEDAPITDLFGPESNWINEGERWAGSPLVTKIREACPEPPWWLFLENNEGMSEGDKLGRYHDLLLGNSPDGQNRKWKTDAQLETLSLRMRDRVRELRATEPEPNPYDFFPESWGRHTTPRRSLQEAFDLGMTDWTGGLFGGYGAGTDPGVPERFKAEYGPCPRDAHFDFGSPSYYIAGGQFSDFTLAAHYLFARQHIPSYAWRESRGPSVRELSISLGPNGAVQGAVNGKHQPIDPTLYGHLATWAMWSIHEAGRPVCLRYWDNYTTAPDKLFFTSPERLADLDRLGRPDMKTLTVWDYERPVVEAIDRVCEHDVLRRFWTQGVEVPWQPVGLKPGIINPALQTARVETFVVIRQVGAESLIVTWSPVANPAPVTVDIPGIGTAAVQANGYWLARPPSGEAIVERLN